MTDDNGNVKEEVNESSMMNSKNYNDTFKSVRFKNLDKKDPY